MVPSTKKWRIKINPGPILHYALMMKELDLFDSRIKILHQIARSLAGQHLLLKEVILNTTAHVLNKVVTKSSGRVLACR